MPAKFITSAIRAADLPESGKPHICMLGRSNVGKSSLINHLAGQKGLARTSSQPGLTQTINLFEFDGRYMLVDLPGYGYSRKARSKGEGFERMLSGYLSEAELLKLVVLIIDARHGLTELDRDALAQLKEAQLPHVIVANKSDKLSNSQAAQITRELRTEFPDAKVILHSINDSRGLGEIREAIEKAVRAHKEERKG
ncbi:MAG TPA: ribosome biogenesis GTP-binding protein YihA/YsxC [Candidatus Binatia bacterium]|nr:ribosome biogenesis GTP-binding protein YihA/YsxC [Candidatus Binatia bacterium]